MKRVLAVLLSLIIVCGTAPPGYAAEPPTGRLVFMQTAPDGLGHFTLTLTAYDMSIWGVQVCLGYDPDVVTPIDGSGAPTLDFWDCATLDADWMLTLCTGLDTQQGYIDAGVVTTLGGDAGGRLNSRSEFEVGSEGLQIYTFRFQQMSEGDPGFHISDKGNETLVLDMDSALPIEFYFITAPTTAEDPAQTGNRGEAVPFRPAKTVQRLLEGAVILPIGSHAAVVEGGITAIYPGEQNVTSYVRNNRTFVPIRFVGEQLGAVVDWEQNTQTVIIRKNSRTVRMPIGSNVYTVDGEEREIDAPAELLPSTEGNARTMVPIRFISEALGYQVEWDPDRNLAVVVPKELDWDSTGAVEHDTMDKAIQLVSLYGSFV